MASELHEFSFECSSIFFIFRYIYLNNVIIIFEKALPAQTFSLDVLINMHSFVNNQ